MGEDRAMLGEKKNGDVLSTRQRHSSVISSCSEDAESETTSSGYPPTPDEEKEEELEYGPGIVNKLRTKFLSISLKQNRGSTMRRSCSMENLLDQDRPSSSCMFSQNKFNELKDQNERKNQVWGNLKRAKSMDTLFMDLQRESSPVLTQPELNSDVKKEPKIIRRCDAGLNRTGPTICDEELPKPDTVKTYKRMFEPAESRRGSYSRKPPVLRASAKSGSLSVSKINGVSPSAKVNGTVLKNKLCAKQSPPVKAQPDSEVITSHPKTNQRLVNKEDSKSLCNGSYVKASPIKINDNSLCNGNVVKTLEKEMNGLNTSKNNLNNQKSNIVCNGNSILKELIKSETKEEYVKPDVKKLVNQTYKVLNNNVNQVSPILNGLNPKPKVPPNRPAFIKNLRPSAKVAELNGVEKKAPLIPKLKPVSSPPPKKIQDIVKSEINNKSEEAITIEPRLNGSVTRETIEKKIEAPKVTEENKTVDENNKKNIAKPEPEATEVIVSEKTEQIPKKETEKRITSHINGDAVDNEKVKKTSIIKSDSTDVKLEPKPVKKQQSSEPITTSMVFDFRGKDVVPHVAVLPVPFGCKALHPKKKPLLIDGKEVPNGNGVASDDDDEYQMDYSVPPPSGVIFEGENVKIGKGSILSIRNKDLKIKFDDNMDDNTFVYPSENSLMEDSESSLSPSPPPVEVIPNGQTSPSKLKTNPAIGSSGAGGLSTYTPSVLRTVDNFEPGMFRPPPAVSEKEDDKNVQSGEEENTEVRENCQEDREMLKPADPDIISSWSLSAGTSDLLF